MGGRRIRSEPEKEASSLTRWAFPTRRKPDPKFFQLALDRLGVKAEETVFLDDIGHNLAAAAKMGIKTIRKCDGFTRPHGQRDARHCGACFLTFPVCLLPLNRLAFAGVNLGQSRQALEELERVLDMKLLSTPAAKSKL